MNKNCHEDQCAHDRMRTLTLLIDDTGEPLNLGLTRKPLCSKKPYKRCGGLLVHTRRTEAR